MINMKKFIDNIIWGLIYIFTLNIEVVKQNTINMVESYAEKDAMAYLIQCQVVKFEVIKNRYTQ